MEFQRPAVERRIEDLEMMEAESLEADLQQEVKLRQEDDLRWTEVKTT